jgi:hypothetical protein
MIHLRVNSYRIPDPVGMYAKRKWLAWAQRTESGASLEFDFGGVAEEVREREIRE